MSATGLARFREAQRATWPTALAELHAGAKRSHWMWWIFPQLSGLGRSPTAQRYAIAGLDEARAYLADPVLGPRLEDAARALLAHRDRPADEVLGPVDAMKLRSSATLFEAAGGGPVFAELLATFHGGDRCPRTLRALGR